MTTCRAPAGALKIHAFRPSKRGTATAQTTLLLPELQPHNTYSEVGSHTAPFTAARPAPPGTPFTTAEDARVHVMAIATVPANNHPGGRHMGSFTVIVRNRALLAFAGTPAEDGEGPDVEVPWEEWGPANTRWLSERHRHAWLRYVRFGVMGDIVLG